MEYTLWDVEDTHIEMKSSVLILILMEYTLWEGGVNANDELRGVLILILMEYTLWDITLWKYKTFFLLS